MKYVFRAIRYFLFISILFVLILATLMLTKILDSNIEELFRNGYDSIWQIEILFFIVSFAYPKMGYIKKGAIVPGEYSQIRGQIVNFMKERDYELVSEENENLIFRPGKAYSRIFSKTDSTVSFTRELPGFYVEGAAKDVMRLVSALESRFNRPEE